MDQSAYHETQITNEIYDVRGRQIWALLSEMYISTRGHGCIYKIKGVGILSTLWSGKEDI
jgi:hypothetical protein